MGDTETRLDFGRPAIAAAVSDSELGEMEGALLEAVDLVELRMDHFADLSSGYVRDVFARASSLGKPLIATVRSADEGGHRYIADSERLRLFEAARDFVRIIDIEAGSAIFDEVMGIARSSGGVLMASYHDFKGTPPYDELDRMLKQWRRRGADVVKIAVTARDEADLRTMTLLTLNHFREGVVTISMGGKGLISRVFFPLIGSLFTFASVGLSKAPGQVPVLELRKYMEVLSGG